MNKIPVIITGCMLLYLIAPPVCEGQLCASVASSGLFGTYYQDGGSCTWYSTCPDDIDCSICTPSDLNMTACPADKCLLYLTNNQAYGNQCGNSFCDNYARCLSCMSNCSLPEVGITSLPSYRLYFSYRIGYFYQAEN